VIRGTCLTLVTGGSTAGPNDGGCIGTVRLGVGHTPGGAARRQLARAVELRNSSALTPYSDGLERLLRRYSIDCTVQCVLTLTSRLDAMNRLGRALADPTRCRILLALLDGPAYPAQLAESLGLTRSNVSNHLACARGCGLVVAAPEGRQMRYELADAHLAHALRDLLDVVLAVDGSEPCADDLPAVAAVLPERAAR
jgi:ArsR family transcriptional regulator, cadmium/lead-responsive transcriptional repressor